MSKEFLSRVAQYQGKGLFGTDIKARGEELVNKRLETTTNVVSQAAQELALLSGSADMKTTDEKIDELSKLPDVLKSSKDAQELTNRVGALQDEISVKQDAYNKIYNKTIASLGGVGGDHATQALNVMMREKGLTNKELDSKIDEINLQVSRQVAYDSAVINDKKLLQIEENEEHRRLVNIGYESLLRDVEYTALQDLYVDKSSKQDLERYERQKSALIEKHFGTLSQSEEGMTRKILEDAFGVANLYSGKFASNRKAPTGPEDKFKYESSLDYMKTITALTEQAGGIEDVIKAVRTPKDYWIEGAPTEGEDAPLIQQGSMLHTRLIEAFGGKPGETTRYDLASQTVATMNPYFGKSKNIQNKVREELWTDSKAIIPPILDMPLYAPEDEELNDVLLFNGSSLIGDVSYDPETIRKYRADIQDAIKDPEFLRPIVEKGKVIRDILPNPYTSQSWQPTEKPQELDNYQKITMTAQALARDGITNDEKALFEQQEAAKNAEYASRVDPTTGKPMPYVEPVAGVKSNIDFARSNVRTKSMVQWEPSVVGAASQYDLHQDMVRSIIYHESGFGNPDAVSHTGVKGIAQITGDTLDEIVNRLRIVPDAWTVEDIKKDPVKQIHAGAAYLKHLEGEMIPLVSTRDSLDTATKLGYNAGPVRAKQMIDFGLLDFIKVGVNNPKIHEYLKDQRKDFMSAYNVNITPTRWNEMIKFPSVVNRDYKDFSTK